MNFLIGCLFVILLLVILIGIPLVVIFGIPHLYTILKVKHFVKKYRIQEFEVEVVRRVDDLGEVSYGVVILKDEVQRKKYNCHNLDRVADKLEESYREITPRIHKEKRIV